MPQRVPLHRPKKSQAPQSAKKADQLRPNAAQRGYCSDSWRRMRREVLIRDGWQCKSCGKVCVARREAHVDHIVDKKDGGEDSLENLQTLCHSCHSKKTILKTRNSRP